MKRLLRLPRFFCFSVVMAAALGSAFVEASPLKLRISIVSGLASSKGQSCLRFKRNLERVSAQKIQVEIHPDGKLFHDREELEALQLGAVEMVVSSFTKFDAIDVPELSVFAMPFLFNGLREAHAIFDGPVGKQILRMLEPKGIKGLAIWDLGFYQFHANKSIHEPAQMKGLTYRIIRGKIFEAVAKALQTRPVLLPRGAGMMDGFAAKKVESGTSPLAIFYNDGLTKAQKHLTVVSSSFHGYVVAVNLKFWNSLGREQQAQVEESLVEATQFERELAQKEDSEALESLKKEGKTQVYFPSDLELTSWKTTLSPVSERFKAEREGLFLGAIQTAIGQMRK